MAVNLCFSTLGCADRDLSAVLSLCKKTGVCAVELRGVGGELDFRRMPDFAPDRIGATRERFAAAGVAPLVLGSSCAFHDPSLWQNAVDEGVSVVRTAAALGAAYVRVFGNRAVGERPAAPVIGGIEAVLDATPETNIAVLLEVHGDFNTVAALSPLLEHFKNEPRFGLIWDIAHSHPAYGDDWPAFYRAVAPFVRHVHIKDARGGALVLPGEGDIPIVPIVRRLLADGYDGAFSLEWEKKWHPELPPLETALDAFVNLMKTAL